MRPLIVDALAHGRGSRVATRDVIGVGPRAIAGVLEARGHPPRIALAEQVITGAIDLAEYDILLVSGMTADLHTVRKVVSQWRGESNGSVVVGGPISSEPAIALEKTGADIAVVGEAELTLNELMDAGLIQDGLPRIRSLERVRGVAFPRGEETCFTGLRPVMKRSVFDTFTPSTNAIADYPLYTSARVYVEAVRGCSNYHRSTLGAGGCLDCGLCREGSLEERYDCPAGFPPGCGYCSVPSLYGPPKSRSIDRVANEVHALLDLGVKRIVLSAPGFLDYGRDLLVEPSPLTDPRHPEPNYEAIEGLLSRLTGLDGFSEGSYSLMIENIKGSLVTDKAAKILGRYLKGTPVNIGFETGSPEHSVRLGRPSTPAENLAAIGKLRKAGMLPYAYFIHGLPGQSETTVEETVKTINASVNSGASRIILYRFQPLPMSAFHEMPRAPPAARDKLSKRISLATNGANKGLKEDLVGQEISVVVAEPYRKDRGLHVAYPMLHGPVVLVEGVQGRIGEVIRIKVAGVVSDRMVRGRPVDVMF